MSTGTIFNIERFSIYDGPGARTTVFFKGCNLKCRWCHNPESIPAHPLLEFFPDKCIGCGRCYTICPIGAHKSDRDGLHYIDRSACACCMKCVDSCFAEALASVGETVTSEHVIKSVLSDIEYYKASGGGVTFSGGECMLQIDFLADIAATLHDQGIHIAIDTAGHQPWERFERILPYTDLFLYDVKAASSETHKKLTGVTNTLIVSNLHKLSDLGVPLWVRVPYIPGCNDAEMPMIADLLQDLHIERIEILPFHQLGEGKYTALELENPTFSCSVPTNAEIEDTVAMFRSKGLNAYCN